mmetsp:Transcript_9845/g.21328  ORF Transcript_9845/g.21328 Transcript_9845/m.21328 type:complete len:630 (+) Transcript_9845:157-2046(+)
MPRIRYVLPFVLWSISARWQASSLITPPPRHGPGSNNRLSPYQLRHNNNNIPWSRFRLGTSSRILPIAVSVHSHGDGSAIAHRESSAIHHSNGSIKPSSSLVNGKDTATAAEHKNNKRNSKSKSAPTDADPAYSVLPRHIAFICDGNSRWASQHSLPESMGHVAGADRVVKLIETLYRLQLPSTSKTEDHSQTKQTAAAAAEATASPTRQPQSNPPNSPQNQKQNQKQQKRIEYCTLFAFSTENWSRPPHEISALFQLVERTANQYRQHEAITKGKLQIELLGNMDDDRIPNGARTELLLLQEESRLACDARRRSRRRKDTTVEEEGGDGVKNNDVVDYDDDDDDDEEDGDDSQADAEDGSNIGGGFCGDCCGKKKKKKRRSKKKGKASELMLLVRHYGVRLFGTSVTWLLWDIAYYGNKLFQSSFLIALTGDDATLVDIMGASAINAFIALLGYYAAASIVDDPDVGRLALQQTGFVITGTLFLLCGTLNDRLSSTWLIIMYFASSFFGQCGPNCTTFLIPTEIFPTNQRALCHGISASMGKLGALIASILFHFVTERDLFLFSGYAAFAASLITFVTIPETTTLDLYEIDKQWHKVLIGEKYEGPATDPKHLSFYERNQNRLCCSKR